MNNNYLLLYLLKSIQINHMIWFMWIVWFPQKDPTDMIFNNPIVIFIFIILLLYSYTFVMEHRNMMSLNRSFICMSHARHISRI